MKSSAGDDTATLEFLKSMSIFEELSGEQLEKIRQTMKPIHYARGETILREGENGDSLYLMRSGAVEVTKTLVLKLAQHSFEDRDKTVTTFRAGPDTFFGEIGLLDRTVRTATVRAIEDCVLYEITKADFDRLAVSDSDLGLKVIRAISKILFTRLASTSQDIIKLTTALSIAIR